MTGLLIFTAGAGVGFALAMFTAAVRRECDPMAEYLAEAHERRAAWSEGRASSPPPQDETKGTAA